MAAPDTSGILRIPGRLAVNTTSLATAWPHGGTGIGVVRDIVLKPVRSWEVIREEAFGNEVIDLLDLGEAWVLGCSARSFDGELLRRCFASTEVGSFTTDRGIKYPTATSGAVFREGTLRSNAAIQLTFTPDDPERHPFIVLYNALPMVDPDAELKFRHDDETTTPVVFFGSRDSSGRVVAVQRREDITL